MNNPKKILGIILLAVAVLSLLFALVCFAMEPDNISGSIELEAEYGGDAYTGIQNAAAQAATNARHINYNLAALINTVATIAGFIFVLIGVLCGGLGYVNLINSKEASLSQKALNAFNKESGTISNAQSTINPSTTQANVPAGEKKCWACGKVQLISNRFCSNCSEQI